MALFQKTGQDRVSAIVNKMSTIVDELIVAIEEIDSQIRQNDIARAQLELDTLDLTTSRQQASTLASNLTALFNRKV